MRFDNVRVGYLYVIQQKIAKANDYELRESSTRLQGTPTSVR
ncbi:MAG: hypothetical protein ACJAXR_000972 [Halopseudomonas sp.]|jgi:hypothetical protein